MDSKKNASGLLVLIVIIIGGMYFKMHDYDKNCRSHDSFMFVCRHNDTNTDIYLRRISEKLNQIFEQHDKRSLRQKSYDEIENETYRSRMIVSCSLSQLELLRKGNLTTNFWINLFVPKLFLHEDNVSYDHYNDAIVCSLTERFNYTKEEAHVLLRQILPERTSGIIEWSLLNNIEQGLDDVIQYETLMVLYGQYSSSLSDNLSSIICDTIEQCCLINKKQLLDDIENKKIKNYDNLSVKIHKLIRQHINKN